MPRPEVRHEAMRLGLLSPDLAADVVQGSRAGPQEAPPEKDVEHLCIVYRMDSMGGMNETGSEGENNTGWQDVVQLIVLQVQ